MGLKAKVKRISKKQATPQGLTPEALIPEAVPLKALPEAKPQAQAGPLVGGKYLRVLDSHVESLRHLPAHGNRTLHLHPLVLALVSSFYNPCIRSLRTLEVRRDLPALTDGKIDHLCRSTTSDALAAFDPELLRPVIASLLEAIEGGVKGEKG